MVGAMKTDLTTSAIAEFKMCFEDGVSNIVKACNAYVKAIDNNPDAQEEFRKAFPIISEGAWASFEAVGRKIIHHRLLFGDNPAFNKLKRLPYSQQESAIENGIEILVEGGDTLKVKPENLTAFQRKQAFTEDHVRSLPEQKAYLESLKIIEGKTQKAGSPYEIKGQKIIIPPHAVSLEFTRQEWARILAEIA
jgi:hypothetical protein